MKKKKTIIDQEEEERLIEEDKKNIHQLLKKVPINMEITQYQENLAVSLALTDGYNITDCYHAAADLETNHVKPALEISRMYDIPINDLIHHIKKKQRGLGSALIAANFVNSLRGYGQEITLEQGYSYWKVLKNKINNKDYRAISQLEEVVLLSSGKSVKIDSAYEIEGVTRDITEEETYRDWEKNWFDRDYDGSDEELARMRSDPNNKIALDIDTLGNNLTDIIKSDEISMDLPVLNPSINLSPRVPGHYAEDYLGDGMQIKSLKKK